MRHIDFNAGHLHIRQHVNQRQFDFPVQRRRFLIQQAPQLLRQLPGDVGILGGILRGLLDRHLVKPDLLHPLARHLFIVDGLAPQVLHRQVVHVVIALGRIEHIRRQHGIELDAGQLHTFAGEDNQVVFYILPALFNGSIFQQRF